MILTYLEDLKDFRRKQAQIYGLKYIVLFSIMAVLSNAKSYRNISQFISGHFIVLKKHFNLWWKKPPSYTTIRNILLGIDPMELESCFRAYSGSLLDEVEVTSNICIAVDGKVLRGSFDHFKDKKAIQLLSFFRTDNKLILAHEMIDEKSNEIPAMQHLLNELELSGYMYTADAMHCQKKLLKLEKPNQRQCLYS